MPDRDLIGVAHSGIGHACVTLEFGIEIVWSSRLGTLIGREEVGSC